MIQMFIAVNSTPKGNGQALGMKIKDNNRQAIIHTAMVKPITVTMREITENGMVVTP